MTVDDTAITAYIEKLIEDKELVPDDLVCTFISRRVLPLQRRSHKLCHMSGRKDPTRFTTFRLDQAQIRQQVKAISESQLAEDWDWGKMPHRCTRMVQNVSFA